MKKQEEKEGMEIIAQVLDSFKIKWKDMQATRGTSLTLYEFRPEIGTKLSKIRNIKDELTVALQAESVRVIAPIPGRGTVGIEVPHRHKDILHADEIFDSEDFLTTDMELPLAIGKTITNKIFMADLADMPHLLVAGATGQGKSVGLNVMLMSLIKKKTPDEMKLVLIDPKKVELSVYSKLEKTYLAAPVICETDQARHILDCLCTIMDERYALVNSAGVRNIKEYNALSIVEPLPYIVVVIDEYGDLIMTAGKELELSICRLAQKARAVGIHLIISTQRPAATIVTGNIKANFPTRIAFRTTTGTDSRVILDQIGAEKLTGNGDMLYFSGAETTRVQCAYASIEEVIRMCEEVSEGYEDYENQVIFKEPKPRRMFSNYIFATIERLAEELVGYDVVNIGIVLDTMRRDLADKSIALPRCKRYFRQLVELRILKAMPDSEETGNYLMMAKTKEEAKQMYMKGVSNFPFIIED